MRKKFPYIQHNIFESPTIHRYFQIICYNMQRWKVWPDSVSGISMQSPMAMKLFLTQTQLLQAYRGKVTSVCSKWHHMFFDTTKAKFLQTTTIDKYLGLFLHHNHNHNLHLKLWYITCLFEEGSVLSLSVFDQCFKQSVYLLCSSVRSRLGSATSSPLCTV